MCILAMAFKNQLIQLSLKQNADIMEKLKSSATFKMICNEFKIYNQQFP